MMRLYFLSALAALICSCGGIASSDEIVQESIENEFCYSTPDSIIRYGMAPLTDEVSNKPFVGIKTCYKKIEDDSLRFEIELSNLPDSVLINNNDISFGYSEYGLEIVCRNQDDTTRQDNVVLSVEYSRPEPKSPQKLISIDDYLKKCRVNSYIETTQVGQELHERKTKGIDANYNFYRTENTLILSIPIYEMCDFIDEYMRDGYYVKTSFNKPIESGQNNFFTGYLSSDGWVRHFYIYNAARKISD